MIGTTLRTRALFALTTAGLGAALLTACAGRTSSGGATQSQMEPVSVGDVGGAIVACGEGYAHPNVCCAAGPGTPTSCGVYPEAPFHACDSGAVTYPDPRSCCPMDGSAPCVAPPTEPPPVPPGGSCQYACPVGQYQPADAPIGTCCQTGPDGSTSCYGGGYATSGGGVSSGGPAGAGNTAGSSSGASSSSSSGGTISTSCNVGCACACPAGGAPCPPCDCPAPDPSCPPPPPPPPPVCGVNTTLCECPSCPAGTPCGCDCPAPDPCPPPNCGVCPPGWQVPAGGDAYLCCREDAGNAIECFSQAIPPAPVPISQPGTPVPVGATGG